MLVSMAEILNRAREGGYGLVAPNVANQLQIQAALAAAEEYNTPMILDVTYGDAGPDIYFFGKMIVELCRSARIPVCINQDHGATLAHAAQAIRAGFTSVMADRSKLSFEENVAQVSEIARFAHACGVSVEAELGHVGSGENYAVDRDAALTDPQEAAEYVRQTGVDCLAVAIGTAHGAYTGEPYLDFPLLHKIVQAVDVPLVLHGGSGTGDENLARACREGINKVNISSDNYNSALAKAQAEFPGLSKGRLVFGILTEGWKESVVHYIKLFGQQDRAANW